jgi:hypothetical protein
MMMDGVPDVRAKEVRPLSLSGKSTPCETATGSLRELTASIS